MDVTTWAFVGVALVVAMTPGPDMTLVARNTLADGRAAGYLTVLGIMTGLALWAVAAVGGISAVLAASATAFIALKLGGAAYLIILGVMTLRSARHRPADVDPDLRQRGARRFWLQGFLSAALNPKLGVFYVTLLPQFVEPGQSPFLRSLELAVLFAVIGVVWLLTFTEVLVRFGRRFGAGSSALVRRVSGVVLIGLGLRVALTE